MDTSAIVTAGDFVRFVRNLSQANAAEYEGSLEEYLRSVLAVVSPHSEEVPTWQLLSDVLAEAFTTSPLPFDSHWLEITGPPPLDRDIPRFRAIASPFEHVRHMLIYQIADLYRMAEAGTLDNPHKWFGIASPAGHHWYNFDPGGFLECAIGGMSEVSTGTECSWTDLSTVLWLGQIYE